MKNDSIEEAQHTVEIWEANQDRLALMRQKIAERPKLLSRAAGKSTCSVFRVPQSFIDINGKAYQPHIVSIGPFHRGEPHLQMIEEHKWRYLGSLLNRTEAKGLRLEDYLQAVVKLESKCRECYSETIQLDTAEFVEMMVVDACFIIELFRKVGEVVKFEVDDPLVSMAWILPFFYRDFIRIENQIPLFVLDCLFDLTKSDESGPCLASLAMQFFNNALQRPDEIIGKYNKLEGRHLLDMLRSSLIPSHLKQIDAQDQAETTPSHVIHCVSKLRRSGIKLRTAIADSFLTINFRKGTIEMPTIAIDDFMSAFLQNCVAFEQCHKSCSKHITTYATFLDCLVNTYKDVEYLCDRNIVENYFGTDSEIAKFINDLGKDVAFDIDRCYLAKLFNDVHKYYLDSWHVQWASFKYTYFVTPWSFISALAALILLLLTVAQTFFTIYQP